MLLPNDTLARKVIEHSVDGLLVIAADGVVLFANPAAIALFAGRTKELVGFHLGEPLWFRRDRGRGWTKELVGFHLGEPAIHEAVEIILPGADSARYVEMRSTEIVWEDRTATLASLRDITERKQAEEALLKQAEELRERNSALISFNRAAVGRELRMIELKREVSELCAKLGEAPRYRIPGDETLPDGNVRGPGEQPRLNV